MQESSAAAHIFTAQAFRMLSTAAKTLQLLDRRERWHFAGLFVAMLVTAVVEVAGVASIMPFMALVADPAGAMANEWVRWLYDAGRFTTERSFLIAAGLLVLITISLSNAVAACTAWLVLRFVWGTHHRLSVELLGRYLHEPYEFYLTHNTSTLSKNLLSEVQAVIHGVAIPGLQAIAKAIVSSCVLGLLFIVDAALALVVAAVLGGAYALIYLSVRGTQSRIGREKVAANAQRFKLAGEAFGGIKDVKVYGREDEFIARFRGPSRRFAAYSARNAIIGQLPRFALEVVAFGGIIVLILYMLASGAEVGRIIPMVSLYALAGYRLLPSLQQVYLGITQARFNTAAVDVLHSDLLAARRRAERRAQNRDDPYREPTRTAAKIELRRISFRYEGSKRWALEDVDICIPRNHTVALVGSTGCGKTTLVDLLMGLLTPQRGELLVDGVPVQESGFRAWRQRIGYVPQQIFLCDDTITRNIAFGIPEHAIDTSAVERASRIANLHEFVCRIPSGYDAIVGERGVRLSGGQRQRIGIARALYHDPEILIMDEATSALDGVTESAVMEAIHRLTRQKTIILIAHRLTTVRDSDTIFVLRDGKVCSEGTYKGLMENSALFRSMASAGDHDQHSPPPPAGEQPAAIEHVR